MNYPTSVADSPLGSRIHVIGNSCSGKSSLAERLARILDVPLVELDALNWEPDWVGLNATDPGKLERRIREATAGDAWVVAGSYTDFSQRVFWSRLQTVIWLDLPVLKLLGRAVTRSWRRWRSRELLWGTNYDRFWPQVFVWRKSDSLLWWIVTRHHGKRRRMLEFITSREWSHIRFIRLMSVAEVEDFVAAVEVAVVRVDKVTTGHAEAVIERSAAS